MANLQISASSEGWRRPVQHALVAVLAIWGLSLWGLLVVAAILILADLPPETLIAIDPALVNPELSMLSAGSLVVAAMPIVSGLGALLLFVTAFAEMRKRRSRDRERSPYMGRFVAAFAVTIGLTLVISQALLIVLLA